MKKHLINAGILLAVFLIAVNVFSLLTNKGNESTTADMSGATLPQISFSYNGYNMNLLPGYVEKMEINSMRDTITPVADGKISANISAYGNTYTSLEYQIYTLDGSEKLAAGTIKEVKDTVEIDLKDSKLKNSARKAQDEAAMDEEAKDQDQAGVNYILQEERVLILILTDEDDKAVYFYTRIRDVADTGMINCLDYVSSFHDNALAGQDPDDEISSALETDSSAVDSYRHVTINSAYKTVLWGELKPEIVGGMRWNVKELGDNYTALQLQYQVRCIGEENDTDLYVVTEFFRVRYDSYTKTNYLLNYDRSMSQVFDTSKQVLSSKGILLGIVPVDTQYQVNKNGTIVSFVVSGELWNYNKSSDEMSKVFSFADAERADLRNLNPKYDIKILDVDKSGNTTFAVYGYMNRGGHEGQVGVAVYYYDISKNSVDERVFIKSNKSYEIVQQELESLIYYDEAQNRLYAMVDGNLYDCNVTLNTKDKLVTDLSENQYMVSEDSSMVAYQTNGDLDTATEMEVRNLAEGTSFKLTCQEGECIRPLGFVKTDVVYGLAKTADTGSTASGETVLPMYKIEIADETGTVVKTYENQDIYISGISIEDNMITVERLTKEGESYASTAKDYITNNDQQKESNITLETYLTDLKGTQVRLTYTEGISDQNPRVLNPKQVMYENTVDLSFDEKASASTDKYYVYATGTLQKIYNKAATAIQAADSLYGVVVDEKQQYIWERGNRDLYCELDCSEESISKLKSALSQGKSAVDAVGEVNDGKVLDLSGCSVEELLYIIDQGKPVVAMLDSNTSVLLVGYDDSKVYYLGLSDEESTEITYEELASKTTASGHTYIGFGK